MSYVYVRCRGLFFFSVPSLVSVSASLFPVMPKCARTLCMWILCEVQYIWCKFLLVIDMGAVVVMLGVVCVVY